MIKRKHILLDSPDLPPPSDAYLYQELDELGRVQWQDRFRHLLCKKCGTLDEVAALHEPNLRLATPPAARGRDAWSTGDYQLIVSPRVREVFHKYESLLEYIEPKSDHGWLALLPKVIIRPQSIAVYKPTEDRRPGDAFQTRLGVCPKCGSHRMMTWNPDYFNVPEGVVIAAVRIEHRPIASLAYIISAEVAALVKENKLRGFKFRSTILASDRPNA